jgi:hypothetical protein
MAGSPFEQEEAGQEDTGQPGWNPWNGPSKPAWYAGLGDQQDPLDIIAKPLASGVAKGELLFGGLASAIGSADMGDDLAPTPHDQAASDALGEMIKADAKARIKNLTPDPATNGIAMQTLHSLGEGLGTAAAGAAMGGPIGAFTALSSTQGYSAYQDLLDQGVRPGVAAGLGTVRGLLAGAGAVTPMAFGQTLIPRLLSGTAANVGFGVADRSIDSAILRRAGYTDMADQEQAFDRTQLFVDLALGAGFGLQAHLEHAPAMQAILDNDSSNRDAALTANLALRNRRSGPGVPVTPMDAAAHDAALQKAVQDLQNGARVNVAGTGVEDSQVLTRGGVVNPDVTALFEQTLRESGLLEEQDKLEQMQAILGRKLSGEPEPEAPASRAGEIARAGDLSPEDSLIEDRFANQVGGDYEGAKADYAQLEDSKNGRVINTDTARELSTDYLADRTKSAAVHEPASWLTKQMYAEALAQPPEEGREPLVMFTAGGTGAGKSSALRDALGPLADKAQTVFDTNMNGTKSAKGKIDQALKAGKAVSIIYTYRDPAEALTHGALPRAMHQEAKFGSGRTVPLEEHIKTHVGSNKTIRELAAHYKGNPMVDIRVLDNTQGKGNAKVIPLSKLPKLAENTVREQVSKALEEAHTRGDISESVYRGFKSAGEGPPSGRPGAGPGDGGQPEPQRAGGRRDQLETVSTAAGRQIQVRSRVAELSDLITSDNAAFSQELQPRQRGERAALGMQVKDIAANLVPERLGASPEADRGAPIVSAGNEVESGNGRVMALKQVYAGNPESAQAYKDFLTSQGHDVTGMKQPVLVRERVTPMSMADRQAFAIEANQSATASMSAVERGQADARRLDTGMLDLLADRGDMDSRANAPFVRAFIDGVPAGERNALLNPDGTLSQEGTRRLQAAVLSKAFGGTEGSNRILGRMLESTDADQRNILGALLDTSPAFARLRQMVEDHVLGEQFDITRQVLSAVEESAKLRESGQSLEEHLAQTDMLTARDPVRDAILRTFYGKDGKRAAGRQKVAEALSDYVNKAAAQRLDQGSLFADAPLSPDRLLEASLAGRKEEVAPKVVDMFGLRTPQGKRETKAPSGVTDEGSGATKGQSGETGARLADLALADRPNLSITLNDGSTVPAAAAKLQADEEAARTESMAPTLLQSAADCFLRTGS